MTRSNRWRAVRQRMGGVALLPLALVLVSPGHGLAQETTGRFAGQKVKQGVAAHSVAGMTHTLTLSEDFVIPDAPAPHWQLIDSQGNTYLLQRLVVKGDVFHRSITVPTYVRDVVTVQIWCAWAETLLGEASFASPIRTSRGS